MEFRGFIDKREAERTEFIDGIGSRLLNFILQRKADGLMLSLLKFLLEGFEILDELESLCMSFR